ncbi:MAG: RNA methyltransferase [Acholeplasmatales bacterium]|nr:RNA methyltransferase [Acholeplasmatales bacterium]
MIISSVDNPKIKYLCKLNKASFRKKEGKFIVEGKHLVKEARLKKILIEAYSIEEKEGYITVSDNVMKKITNTDTVVSEIGLCHMILKKELTDKLLILDSIQDPGNMGALMRSAKAFGFDTIVLGDGSVDIYNDKVIRSSQGAIFKLNFINAYLPDFIKSLNGYLVYGTDVVNGIPLEKVKKEAKIALVLGNEGNGISNEVKNVIEKNIYIPMDDTESLNVAVAGGIIMYELK